MMYGSYDDERDYPYEIFPDCPICHLTVDFRTGLISDGGVVHISCFYGPGHVIPQPPNRMVVSGEEEDAARYAIMHLPSRVIREYRELTEYEIGTLLDSFAPKWNKWKQNHPNYVEGDCALDSEPLPDWYKALML